MNQIKPRAKRSRIWQLDKGELVKLVKQSNTFSRILKHFDLNNKGGNLKTLKNRLLHDKIDFSHIQQGLNSNKGRTFRVQCRPYSEILVENSNYSRWFLKQRLIKDKLILHKCIACGLGNTWNGKTITLHLDHINGVGDDNRLRNLRLLCPNCHSQTPTYTGKNNKQP